MTRSALTILLAAFGLATDASAQIIRGRVVEDGPQRAIAHADVALLNERGTPIQSTRADSLGEFRFEAPAGEYAFVVSAVGFVTATTPAVGLGDGEELQVRIVLSPRAILLAPLEITARSRPLISGMLMQAYHERRAKNQGFAITREQIEERQPRRVTDLLHMVPGVNVIFRFGGSAVQIPGSGRRFLPTCEVKVVVDGNLYRWGGTTIDDIPIDDVEAIEVFRNLAEIPPEFAGPDATCGVIAVWTKRGRN